MERFPVELLYVLGFVVFVIFNYFLQKAARRRQQEEQAQAEAEAAQAPPPPAEEQPLEDIWGRRPAPVQVPASVPRPAPPPLRAEAPRVRRLHPVRALLADKRDLRRAVILMMVLGPCRSEEPPER